ncbi:neutral ceramidase-like [Plodia interpunctella]|uniref:neutral ceramidase-like n=1 Tax=Plodia interpunctella TaxID=58824 RepID=UPI0023687A2A|nr:neutral ceramidase-like [Plodia interpunctella]XP_053612321.1 neutral ceramidase-like [Plodia interpunctella]
MVSLVGKIVITVVTLAVIAGMTAVIVTLVRKENDVGTTTTSPTTQGTTEPVYEDMLYDVGVGIADMTGPCVEIVFMGYAEIGQTGRGLHTRQYSRAFIFVQGDTRVVLVTADVQAVGIHVRRQVVRNLQELYGDIYTLKNVILAGTHTHSGPGGHLVNFLLDVSIRGFSRQTFDAYVDGITRSIVRAHENIVPARLYYGQTTVNNAQKNRSPYSYDFNPAEERMRYTDNLDHELTQIRIVKQNGDLHGVLNWFALHTTSMNMTNRLISADNFGYAAMKMEKTLNPDSPVGKPEVVAGFFTANLGDVSPNLEEAQCEFSGEYCDNHFHLCAAGERCYALGPGSDMFESTKIIGTRVFEGALRVLNSPGEELTGSIAVRHQFVEIPDEIVARYNPVTRTFNQEDKVRGCSPAMGYSFASGTTDGANTLNITQGTLDGDAFWDFVGGLVAAPTPDDEECHAPKPILLATGRTNIPVPWHPRIVSASLIMLGGLAVIGVPGEPTTMSGRRMRDVVGAVMEDHGVEPRAVVTGLTNEYIHYIATYEEYQVQRYEAASTIYGPHTLEVFLNKFSELATALFEGSEVAEGPEPQDHINNTLSFILPVVTDNAGLLQSFGNVLVQPEPVVRRGDTVSVTFVGANPRNNLKQEETYFVIERQLMGTWEVVATDADWETKFIWERRSTILGTSSVTIEWTVPEHALVTIYRFTYYGTARGLLGSMNDFNGTSDTFSVDI